MAPKKILHVTSVLNYGGIETLFLNVFQNIDREKISFDFLSLREDEGILEDKIRALGGTIYKLPSIKKVGYFKFKKNLDNFFKNLINFFSLLLSKFTVGSSNIKKLYLS